jgi:hypothetical protein
MRSECLFYCLTGEWAGMTLLQMMAFQPVGSVKLINERVRSQSGRVAFAR